MQGIILNTFSVRDKDLIVFILSSEELVKCYRFYGVRHSHLIVGNIIDYELSIQPLFLPKLHSTMQLALPWNDYEIIKAWQSFCVLLYEHLKDNQECGSFYYDLCNQIITRLSIQDYKRVFLDAYASLLEYEGRLNFSEFCYECSIKLKDFFMIGEGFLMYCSSCKNTIKINKFKMEIYIKTKSSAIFEDDEIDKLYLVFSKKI
ncbi:recombination protein RecO [Campylobacter sp. MG1]|uniref:recombination protein RecO n=1 Tax=Campylobacter sp. MG1 TaxID=2976332 RepID=UPI00226D1AF5|nr:recombination protein RecO [Campylobacter sp. MG1]